MTEQDIGTAPTGEDSDKLQFTQFARPPPHGFLKHPYCRLVKGTPQFLVGLYSKDPLKTWQSIKLVLADFEIGQSLRIDNGNGEILSSLPGYQEEEMESKDEGESANIEIDQKAVSQVNGTKQILKYVKDIISKSKFEDLEIQFLKTSTLHIYMHPSPNGKKLVYTDHNGDVILNLKTKDLVNECLVPVIQQFFVGKQTGQEQALLAVYNDAASKFFLGRNDPKRWGAIAATQESIFEQTCPWYYQGPNDTHSAPRYKKPESDSFLLQKLVEENSARFKLLSEREFGPIIPRKRPNTLTDSVDARPTKIPRKSVKEPNKDSDNTNGASSQSFDKLNSFSTKFKNRDFANAEDLLIDLKNYELTSEDRKDPSVQSLFAELADCLNSAFEQTCITKLRLFNLQKEANLFRGDFRESFWYKSNLGQYSLDWSSAMLSS